MVVRMRFELTEDEIRALSHRHGRATSNRSHVKGFIKYAVRIAFDEALDRYYKARKKKRSICI